MMDTSLSMETLLERLELLLDDELDDRERSELLNYLESVPNGWRICAATFLEDQAAKRSIKDGFGNHSRASNMPEGVFEYPKNSQPHVTSKDGATFPQFASIPKEVDRPESESGAGKSRKISLQQAFAVSTLVGFLAILFTIMSVRLFDPSSEAFMDRWIASLPENWDDVNPYEIPATNNPGLRAVGSPKKALLALDPEHEIELPLYNCKSVDPVMFHSYCSVSPALLERLRQTGFEVSVRRRDEIIMLDDGSKVIVPAETVYVRKREGTSHTRKVGAYTVYGPGVLFEDGECTEHIADFMRQSPPSENQGMQLVLAFDSDEKLKEYHFLKGTAKWEIRSLDDLPTDMRTQAQNAIRGCISE